MGAAAPDSHSSASKSVGAARGASLLVAVEEVASRLFAA